MKNLPKVITHKNMLPVMDALREEPYFKFGRHAKNDPKAWYWRVVTLEVACGELCGEDKMKTLALRGVSPITYGKLDGTERFSAQGLEGKASIRKSLFSALMDLRDLIPQHKGRIVT